MGNAKLFEKWEKRKLGEIATYINGKAFKPSEWSTNGIPIIRIQNLNNTGSEINYFLGECDEKYYIKNGDILVSWSGSLGVFKWAGGEAVLNQHIFKVKFDKIKIEKMYFFYMMKSILVDMERYTHGSTMKHITKSKFDNIEIMIPPIGIQSKISEILEKGEKALEKRKEAYGLLDSLVKSRFIEMFGDVFLNTKNFEMKQIKDIVKVVKGITYKPEQINEEGTIVLRSSNIKGSNFDLSDIVRVNKNINEKFLVEVNDILMCNRNGSERLVGKVAKIPEYNEPMTFGTFMTIVRSPYYNYLFSFFQTEAFRRQIKMQTSVAINQISIPLLENVKVPLPPMELQNQFADFVNQVDKLKFEMENSLKVLEDNFHSLMQKAFNGELFTE